VQDSVVNIASDFFRDIALVLPESAANAFTIKMPVCLEHRRGLHFAGIVAVIDAAVLVPIVFEPRQSFLFCFLIIAKLEPYDLVLRVNPHDQVKVLVGKPSSPRFSGYLFNVANLSQHSRL
jgi:hypothetical protein